MLVDELVRGGVRDAVLSPGSRSAPIALALVADPRIRLHVRIDERSAGFLALGLALATNRAVAVVCTSGTAAANLHPAALEASHAGVPLVVLTADRPPELRGIGANQTIDQIGLYAAAPRLAVELGVPEQREGQVRYWRSTIARVLATATRSGDPGPVHVNVAFREPLVPDGDQTWPESLDSDRPQWMEVPTDTVAPPALRDVLGADPPERGAVVVGHGAVDPAAARRLAETLGWPVLSEPTGNARSGPNAVATYPLLLADPTFAAAMRAELVVVVGKPGLSRSLLGWLATAGRQVVVDPRPAWADPVLAAGLVLAAVPTAGPGGRPAAGSRCGSAPARTSSAQEGPTGWLDRWHAADLGARATVDSVLDAEQAVTEPRVARDLVAALPPGAALLLGSSRPIRDVEAYARTRADLAVFGNRGVSGIDGLVSTAVGIALGHDGPTYALLGDLAFLHDHGGLVLGPEEQRPDLVLVVVDNDGGGIFSLLPQAGQPGFERVFGTPHGLDLLAVALATGWPCTVVEGPGDLPGALAGAGPRVVLIRTRREDTAALHRRLQQAVSAALATGSAPR